MLLILLLLLSANNFIKTANGEEAFAISSATAYVKPETGPDNCNTTLTCGDDEILVKCPTYCPSDCCPTGEGQNKRCATPDPCPPPACKCRFNSRRATNGKCISTRKCPPFECTRPNEEYNPCPPFCPTDSCSQATPTGKCPLPGRIGIILECNPTCRCKKNYWRNENGTCVPYNQCPGKLTCGLNEVVDNCPSDCESDKCPTADAAEPSCPKPCQCPPPACKCRFNYSRAPNGTCIPTRECPPFDCYKPNEEFNPCPPYCPTDDCSQATPEGTCPLKGRIGIVVPCRPQCRCKKGYWRLDGFCVPYDKCPGKLTCPDGEVVDNCPQLCNTDYCPKDENDVRTCYTPIRCVEPVCKCPFNHLRAANGTCIPASSCPPIECTGPHEVYNSCPPACPTDDCSEATPTGKCPFPGRIGIAVECRPGCRCEEGYWRKNGTCVPYAECSEIGYPGKNCSLPNEVYTECKKECPSDRCSSVIERCIPSETCSPGCTCAPGYLRKADGEPCMPQCQCPQLANTMECLRCPLPNEEYTTCKKQCPSDRCSSILERCIPSKECSSGCVCSSGYLRKKDGEPCIPICQCPQIQNSSKCKIKVSD